jgi:cell cycle related kinase
VLVFEYLYSDLAELIKSYRPVDAQIKRFMVMILQAVDYCHAKAILHRDLKPANVLISKGGVLKLADFGLSRCKTDRPVSHQVATRWYRSPELLYGAREYDERLDLWAVGCIFGELLNQSPIFPGQNDIDQLYKVQSILGSPDPAQWPECVHLPDYDKIQFSELQATDLKLVCPDASLDTLQLLKKFLVYRSNDRIRSFPIFFLEDNCNSE